MAEAAAAHREMHLREYLEDAIVTTSVDTLSPPEVTSIDCTPRIATELRYGVALGKKHQRDHRRPLKIECHLEDILF